MKKKDINPFKQFDGILVINIDNHVDRWINFTNIAKKYGFYNFVERISAVKHETGSFGCALSHKKSLEIAKERGWKKVLVFEDDVFFLYNKEYVYDCLQKALVNENWDILYLGINPAKELKQKIENINVGDLYEVCGDYFGTFAIVYQNEGLSIFDNISDNINNFTKNHRDDMMLINSNLKKLAIFPMLVSVSDFESFTGTGLDKDGEYKIKNNHIKILKKYEELNLVDYDHVIFPEFYNKPTIQQPTTKKPPQKIITTQPENGNIYVITSQETSRQLKTIQDSIKEFNIIEPTPLDFPEVLNLSYMFEQKLKHDKREIAKKKKEISYSITIRNIIKKAKEKNFRKVIVFQDGITFDKDPNTIIPQLEELPENFGVCFLGGYFRKPFLGSFYDYNEHFLELKGSFKIWGTHAIVIGQEIYDILIKALTMNFDKNFQELLCSIIVGKYPSYTYNLPFVFYDEHFSNRYSINNVTVKTLKQDNLNIIKKSKNNK